MYFAGGHFNLKMLNKHEILYKIGGIFFRRRNSLFKRYYTFLHQKLQKLKFSNIFFNFAELTLAQVINRPTMSKFNQLNL